MADYCTLYDLKSSLSITDSVDDQRLSAAITAASGWVESYCDRSFTQASGSSVKYYVPTGRLEGLQIDDATAITDISVDEDLDETFSFSFAPRDFQLEPVNAQVGGAIWPYTRIVPIEDGYWPVFQGRATVRVTATFGWPSTPVSVVQATLLQSARLFTRMDSPLGVAGFGEMGIMRVSRFIDPDVEMLLAPYRRRRFV